jgi:cytochrome c-type biogenesis protein CcmH/NrfF
MKRHSLDPFSLVFGTAFALLGLIFVITRATVANLHLAWVWPIPLIVLGVLIIALAARGDREKDQEEAID